MESNQSIDRMDESDDTVEWNERLNDGYQLTYKFDYESPNDRTTLDS